MCVSPIYIPTQSKKLYINMRQRLVNCVPCGHCYECKHDKCDELMVRSYYETISSKFVLFDTLTYSEENVPLQNGIRVLRYKDYQDFTKRLRKELDKRDIKYRYIVSGEYGTDERRTHRPHYHFILFVKSDNVRPDELSRLISDKWRYGRTDGIVYKGMHYLMTQRVFTSIDAQKNVVGYVCKYMTKTSKYDNVIRSLAAHLMIKNEDNEFGDNKKIFKKYYDRYKEFVKWSKGFGDAFLENNKLINEYESKLYIQLPTDLKFKKYKLPLYYRRKLYFEKDNDYENVYRLNKRGYELEKKIKGRMVDIMYDKFKSYYDLLDDDVKTEVDRIGLKNISKYVVNEKGYYIYGVDGFDYDTYIEVFNTKNDKMSYENGFVNALHPMTAKNFYEQYSVADSELDEIHYKVMKNIRKLAKIKAVSDEIVKETKKNLKKCLTS